MNAFARNLVDNLKRLNAKERDHLMRYAYLGFAGRYVEDTTCWLSNDFHEHLRSRHAEFKMSKDAKCVFACMDYHLDWLYAALLLACMGKRIADCDERQLARWEMPTIDHPDKSLLPISGCHEDVDLLLVFDDESQITVLLVEAKGVADFDKVQLAHKAIRMHYILKHSRADERSDLAFRFVLMAPDNPKIVNICDYVEIDKHSPEHDALSGKLVAIKRSIEKFQPIFVQIPGFPTELSQVKRADPVADCASASRKRYQKWQLQRRKVRLAVRPLGESDNSGAQTIASGASRNPEAAC